MNNYKVFYSGLRLLLILLAAMFTTVAEAEVVVIVSAKNSVIRLTTEQAAKIFLGKTNTFPNDSNAFPIDQAEGNPSRDEFYSKVANKSASQIKAYWTKIIFTGDGQPPKMLEGDANIRKTVANNPNAIGYIDRSAVDGSVRIVLEP